MFSWIIFPQAPKNNTRVISNFSSQVAPLVLTIPAELVAKFSAFDVDTGGKFAPGVVVTSSNFATGVVDTVGKFAPGIFGGAPWLANISANFRKFLNDLRAIFRGLGKDDSWKTSAVKISSVHPWYRSLCTLRAVAYNSLGHVQYWAFFY